MRYSRCRKKHVGSFPFPAKSRDSESEAGINPFWGRSRWGRDEKLHKQTWPQTILPSIYSLKNPFVSPTAHLHPREALPYPFPPLNWYINLYSWLFREPLHLNVPTCIINFSLLICLLSDLIGRGIFFLPAYVFGRVAGLSK